MTQSRDALLNSIKVPKVGKAMADAIHEYHIDPIAQDKIPPEDKQKIDLAQENFIDFVEYTYPSYKTEPFHRDVAETLDKVVKGEIKRLMLFAPPQHGKSELVSIRFPSYWLARVPNMPIGLISYGASLAQRNSRSAKSVFDTYQYAQTFPHMMKDTGNWRIEDWYVKNHRGYVKVAGVGGPITGHGFGLGIVDDPIENWAAAQSDRIRNSAWEWYQGTFLTRLWEQGVIVLMMTRWHEDDIAARILDSEGRIEEGGEWTVKSYAALAEEANPAKNILPDVLGRDPGEPLAPSRYSKKYLLALEGKMPRVFQAEYQQRPTKPTGQLFKIGQAHILEEPLPPEVGFTDPVTWELISIVNNPRTTFVRYWDLAATEDEMFKRSPDSTVGTLMAKYDTGFLNEIGKKIYQVYVLDVVRERLGPEGVSKLMLQTAKLDGKHVSIVIEQEPGASGKSVIASYKTLLQGYSVKGELPSGNKQVRAMPVVTQFNSSRILVVKGLWNKPWLSELGEFPFGTHDDQVDSLSGAFNALMGTVGKWKDMDFLSA